jgi:4'-phosphopantetheinyl transferase
MPITHAPEPREIHLWCIFSREISNESRPRRYHNPLVERDLRREVHFYFAHDRHRYVMTGASARTASSRYADATPEKLILTSRHGRPEISIGDSAAVVPVSLSTGRQPRRHLEYWILKESYMRAKGGGFSVPLDHFSFHLPHPDSVRLSIDSKSDEVPDCWRFLQFSRGSRHLFAACAAPAGIEPPSRLVLREVVPLASH